MHQQHFSFSMTVFFVLNPSLSMYNSSVAIILLLLCRERSDGGKIHIFFCFPQLDCCDLTRFFFTININNEMRIRTMARVEPKWGNN